MIDRPQTPVESATKVTIEKRLLAAIILKIQQALNTLRSEVRGRARVALFGTIAISPANHLDNLMPVGNHLEVSQAQRDLMSSQVQEFGFHPFNIDTDGGQQKPMDTSGGMPDGCPPMKLVDGRVVIESHNDCITCPFKGIAFDLRGDTTIAFPPEQFPPDIELLAGELWVQDYRSESAIQNLANIKISGPDHSANIKPTRETGLKYTDGQGVTVFSRIGDTWVQIDYIPGDQKLVEKDYLYYLLINEGDSGATCEQPSDAGTVKDSSVVGAEELENEIGGGTASCNTSGAGINCHTELNLEGSLTLGFLIILGTRAKKAKRKKRG